MLNSTVSFSSMQGVESKMIDPLLVSDSEEYSCERTRAKTAALVHWSLSHCSGRAIGSPGWMSSSLAEMIHPFPEAGSDVSSSKSSTVSGPLQTGVGAHA